MKNFAVLTIKILGYFMKAIHDVVLCLIPRPDVISYIMKR
jgi:hypothetical protein